MAQGTVVRPCKCVHKYQDKRYGHGMRLHNLSGKVDNQCRCTVCNEKKNAS